MKKVIIILLTVFVFGCSKEDSSDNQPSINKAIISTEKNNLKDAEIAFINVDNLTLVKDSYNSNLGEISLKLFKVNDSTLTFVVPTNIDSGKYELSTDFSNNSLQFDISTEELSSSSTEIMSNFIGNYEEDIDNTIEQFGNNNVPQELLTAKAKIQQAASDFENLSEQDKIVAAKFIQNNSEGFKEFENELDEMLNNDNSTSKKNNRFNKSNLNCNTGCIFAQGVKILGSAALIKLSAPVGVIAGLVIGIDVGLSYLTGKRSYLLSKLKLALGKAFNIAYFAQNNLADVTFEKTDEFVSDLTNFKKSSSERVKFQNETPISIKIKPYYRTLNIEDKEHPNGNISTFVSLYSKFKTIWDNKLASKFGQLPTFNDNEEQKFADELSQFTIQISDNSENVSVSDITGTVEDFKVTFTNNTDTEQNFSFDIIFNDDGIIAKKSIEAILSIKIYNYKLQIGNYNPDYTQISPLKTLENGDAITIPNYMTQMVRLTLDDVPVPVGQFGLGWTGITFGEIPSSNNDINNPDYSVTVRDSENNRNVSFKLNVTLTNQSYRRFIGGTINADGGSNGTPNGTPRTITINNDKSYSVKYNDGSDAVSGTLSFIDVISESHNSCSTYTDTRKKVGCIRLSSGSSGLFLWFPEYIYLFEDGSLGANSFYGCNDRPQTWHLN